MVARGEPKLHPLLECVSACRELGVAGTVAKLTRPPVEKPRACWQRGIELLQRPVSDEANQHVSLTLCALGRCRARELKDAIKI
jgi:hypothetical protein